MKEETAVTTAENIKSICHSLKRSDRNNNLCPQKKGESHLEYLDELKQVQSMLKTCTEQSESIQCADSKMNIYPHRTLLARQYPISSSGEVFEDENDYSDDSSDYLEEDTKFVRNGFGRMSTISMGPGNENFNSVDEITISGNVLRKLSPR